MHYIRGFFCMTSLLKIQVKIGVIIVEQLSQWSLCYQTMLTPREKKEIISQASSTIERESREGTSSGGCFKSLVIRILALFTTTAVVQRKPCWWRCHALCISISRLIILRQFHFCSEYMAIWNDFSIHWAGRLRREAMKGVYASYSGEWL